MSSILDNFWFLAAASLLVLLAPFWMASIIAYRSPYKIEHRVSFVFVCASFSYGIFFILGFLSQVTEFIVKVIGAHSSDAGFRLSQSLLLYDAGLLILALLVLAVWIPLRISRSWASLVAAWR